MIELKCRSMSICALWEYVNLCNIYALVSDTYLLLIDLSYFSIALTLYVQYILHPPELQNVRYCHRKYHF